MQQPPLLQALDDRWIDHGGRVLHVLGNKKPDTIEKQLRFLTQFLSLHIALG